MAELRPLLSIVIPVYNELPILGALYERLTRAGRVWNVAYEVIAINDGSTDGSGDALAALHRRDARWKVLSLSRNFGHQAAISAGIHYSRGDAVVVMDADLQDPPEELHRFLDKWREGYQVVYAIRTKRKESFIKRAAYTAFYRLLRRVASIDMPLDAGDFCVMDRAVVEVLRAQPERTRFVRGLRTWAGFRQTGIAYERCARLAGEPKYTLPKLLRLAMDGIFCFSSAPLKLAAWMGVASCAASIGMIVGLCGWWYSAVRLFGMHPRDAAGWTSLCSLVLLLFGLQMLMTGIIGEYLARIFDEVKGREPWIIANALGVDPQAFDSRPGWHMPLERSHVARESQAA